MLVVHLASCCDVCLDPYSMSSDPAKSPHAIIACGHIFCLTCLRSLSPNACPLCRKLFQPDDITKLHLSNPPEVDSVERDVINARANILLQRLALVSGEDTPEEDVIEVLTEVQGWLQSQPDDSHVALRASVAALQRYKALQDQSKRTKAEYRRLRHQLRDSKQSADHDSKTSRAVEENLLTRIQQMESEHAQELESLLSQFNTLRNARSRYRSAANPLPAPPELLPIDHLPAITWPGVPSNDSDPLPGGAVPYPPPPHINGDVHPSTSNQSSSHKQSVPVPQPSKSQPAFHPRPPEPPRTEERWASALYSDTTRRPQMPSAHSRPTDFRPVSGGATRGAHSSAGVVHSLRTTSRAPSPCWSARPIIEDRRSDDERELIRKGRDTAQNIVTSVGADIANAVSTRLASAAAYIPGYGSGHESSYQPAGAPHNPSTNGISNGRAFPLQEVQSPERAAGGFGSVGTHSRAGATMEDHSTPVARHPPRRAVTSVTRSGRISRSLSDIPLLDPPVENGAIRRAGPMQSVGQVLGLDSNGAGPSRLNGNTAAVLSRPGGSAVAGPRPNQLEIRMPRPQAIIPPLDTDSESTWETLTIGQEGSSMDHLGLVGLHNGGVRGQGSVAGDSVVGRLSSNEGTTGEDVGTDEVTPVIPPGTDISMLGLILEDGADYPLLNGKPTRYRTPHPAHSSHPTVSRSRTQHPSRAERSTHRRRNTSQPRAYDSEGTTRVPSPTTYNNTNALSLHFDASFSMRDHTSAISAPFTGAGHGPEIIAPIPVVGGLNIVNLWPNRT